MASNAELNNSIIQLTRDVNDLTDAVNVKKQVLDTAVDEAEASETAAAASAAAAANSQTSASASAGAAAQSAADAAEVVTGGEGSLEPLPGKLPIADSRGKILPGWLEHVPSRAEFFARAEQNRRRYAGSGFAEWGKHALGVLVSEGLWLVNGPQTTLTIGRSISPVGVSRTNHPLINANGVLVHIKGLRAADAQNVISFPEAPSNTSLHSRQDLAFIEVWHEQVSDKDFVYPNGCVQYGGTTWEGITLANNDVAASYSGFGAWEQSPVAGYGLRWSAATAAQRDKFLRDPANGFYYDTETGELIQVRWRVRTVGGLGDTWANVAPNATAVESLQYTVSTAEVSAQGLAETPDGAADFSGSVRFVNRTNTTGGQPAIEGDLGAFKSRSSAYTHGNDPRIHLAIPVALIQRRNQGAYHPTYNPSGCAKFLNVDNTTAAFWYDTDRTITSIGDCFSFNTGGDIASSVSGRPDGLYYDQIAARDIRDLRSDANRIEDMDRYLEKHFRRLMAGQIRKGEQGSHLRMVSHVNNNSSGYTNGAKIVGPELALQFSGSLYGFRDANDQRMVILSPVSGTALRYRDNPAASEGNGESRWVRLDGAAADEALADEFRNNNLFPAYITQDVRQFDAPRTATHLHCDIIGDPANYPAEWIQYGVTGQPLVLDEKLSRVYPADVVAENIGGNAGTKSWKLSRPFGASSDIKRVVRWDGTAYSVVSGASNNAGQWTFNTVSNKIFFQDSSWGTSFADTDVFMVFYETPANPMALAVRAKVRALGKVEAACYTGDGNFINIPSMLIGKVATQLSGATLGTVGPITGYFIDNNETLASPSVYRPSHDPLHIAAANSPAVKMLPYLSVAAGKATLHLIAKELKFDTDFGDTGEIEIAENVATATDANGNTVLITQKSVELPAFVLDAQ